MFGARLMTFVVVGPDGSGKSSVAAELTRLLESSGRLVDHRHWRPGVLPRPGRLIGRPARPGDRPHDVDLHGRPVSWLLVLWFFVDFLLGDVRDAARSVVRPRTVIVERGWWDMAIDPTRYRLTPVTRLVEGLGRLLRRPDLFVVLAPDVVTASHRSGELALEEIDRQIRQWRIHAPRFGPAAVLEVGGRTVPEVACDALTAIDSHDSRGAWRVLPSRRRADVVFRATHSKPWVDGVLPVPCTRRAATLNRVTRAVAHGPARHLAPRGKRPPRSMVDAVSTGTDSVVTARRTRGGKWIVAGRTHDGAGLIAKQACDGERSNIARSGDLLSSTLLRGPVVVSPTAASLDVLVTRAEEATDKIRSTRIPLDAARALGEMWRRSGSGFAHGDFAPWNVIPTATGLVLLDWEHAFDDAPPFYDIWHWVVQCHLLLGTASPHDWRQDIPLARAFRAFAAAAELHGAQPDDFLADYLDVSAVAFLVGDRAVRKRRQELRLGSP